MTKEKWNKRKDHTSTTNNKNNKIITKITSKVQSMHHTKWLKKVQLKRKNTHKAKIKRGKSNKKNKSYDHVAYLVLPFFMFFFFFPLPPFFPRFLLFGFLILISYDFGSSSINWNCVKPLRHSHQIVLQIVLQILINLYSSNVLLNFFQILFNRLWAILATILTTILLKMNKILK